VILNNSSGNPATTRVHYLDAIRGLAALSVLWNHFYVAYGIEYFVPILRTPLHLPFDGYAAVSMFFVLSGYVLSARYFAPAALKELNIAAFYTKRCCRIMLPFLAAFALSYLVKVGFYQFIEGNDPELSRWGQKHWSASKLDLPVWDYMKAAVMVLPNTYFPLIPQAWTLNIEMGMSFALPFLVLIACRSSLWLIFFTVIMTNLLGAYIFVFHFTMGILLAKHRLFLVNIFSRNKFFPLGILIIGFIFYTYRLAPEAIALKLSHDPMRFINGIGASLLLIWIMTNSSAQRFLSSKPLLFLGKVSYSLYLIHLVVLLTFSQYLVSILNGIGMESWQSYWMNFLLTTTVSLFIANLGFRYVEIPSMRLGASLSQKIVKLSTGSALDRIRRPS